MDSYGNKNTTNTTVNYIRFTDGSIQRSASTVDDFHIKKKLLADDDTNLKKNVTIGGSLTVAGDVSFLNSTIPDTSREFVINQIAYVYTLLGWNGETSKWIYSDTVNNESTNLDARMKQFFDDYYRKTEIDTQLYDLKGTNYNSGVTGDQYQDPVNLTYYTGKATSIPIDTSFIIPPIVGGMTTYLVIQNSNFGVGKVLTSGATGIATWQDPAVVVTPTIQHISTSYGQSNVPSLDITDTSTTKLIQFLPNIPHINQDTSQANDAVIRSTGSLTISSGTGPSISRPTGIRMDSNSSTGSLTLFAGWNFDATNTQMWNRDGSNQYLGYYSGTNIEINTNGIHMVHDSISHCAIKLYGKVNIYQKQPNQPSHNYNDQIIPAYLSVGQSEYPGTLDVSGSIITDFLRIPTSPTVSYVWTCTNSDGSGQWAAPVSSTSISSFTSDVTFTGKVTTGGDIDCGGNINSSGNITSTGSLTANGDLLFNQNISSTEIIQTGTEPAQTWSEMIDDNSNTNSYDGAYSLSDGGPLSNVLASDNLYYVTMPPMSDINITVPAFTNKSLTFTRSIYLQSNFQFTNPVNKGSKFYWYYNILQYELLVYNSAGQLITNTIINSNIAKRKFRNVEIFYDRDRSGFIGSSSVVLNDQENDNGFIFSHRFELDKIDLQFLPPYSSTNQTYTLKVRVKLNYRYKGILSYFFYYNDIQYVKLLPIVLSYGGWKYSSIPDREVYFYDNSTWTHWQTEVTIHYPITQKFSYSKYKYVNFIRNGVIENSYAFNVNSSNYPVETINLPPLLTNDRYVASINDDIRKDSFLKSGSKLIKISNMAVDKMVVNDLFHVYAPIQSSGYYTRQGIPNPESVGLAYERNFNMLYSKPENIFNFYWTGNMLQSWIDSTLVNVWTPNYSDYRLKSNLKWLSDDYSDKIDQLNLYEYSIKLDMPNSETTHNHVGFLAHELQDIFPNHPHLIIGEKDQIGPNGESIYQSVNYNELTIILIKACQEMKKEMNKNTKKIKKLEAQIDYFSYAINLAFIPLSLTLVLLILIIFSQLNLFSNLHLVAFFRFWF